MNADDVVLSVEGLTVGYRTGRGTLQALRGVSLQVPRGRIVGIVGESGCGKTTLISVVIRLLAPNTEISAGAVRFRGEELLSASEERMRSLRGAELATVFQDPMTSLNPVLTIGRQMADIQYRLGDGRRAKRERSLDMLRRVGIADAGERLDQYPHQLSGGMRQRVAIGMALMMKPALLIADEPTTALDATLEVQIIEQLRSLQAEVGCSILFISHHLGVIAELCDQVVVMYAGEVVESGDVAEVFAAPRHPYTRMLLACDPAAMAARTRTLPIIAGALPDLINLPAGCVYRERCDRAAEICRLQRPRFGALAPGRAVACHLAADAS
jgi:oligopeptide/dipeptide ABC transporter ATP-binding protein